MEPKVPKLPKSGDLVAGRFRILELIGSGGFGTVYRALQENIGRDVAMKFLTPGVAKDPVNVERFRREAYHVSQLRHPNTITLYDYGQTEEGLIYMVMELLEGISLADSVQDEGAIAWPRASHIFIQVLKSLSEAHQRGLVHRDLKPENIFLCELFGEQDYVKVLDFGVAKMTMMDDDEEGEEKLTKAGRIFGTPMYMAPEQACAEEITPATDVYALGLLIFEMLTGLPPVTGRNRMDVIHKQIRDPVPVLTRELEGTPLGKFIRRATEKKPEARYHDAAQMLEGFVGTLRAMRIQPAPRGGTLPEISASMLVPEPLLDERSAPEPAKQEPARQPRSKQAPNAPRLGSSSSDPVVVPSQHGAPPPVPKGLRESSGASSSPSPTGEDATRERRSIVARLANKEKRRPAFGDRPSSKPRYELPLIGREDDVLKLSEIAQENLFSRAGHVVLLEGESGVGKSRVIQALHSQLRNVGVDVCVGHCRRRSLPLESVREAISDVWGVGHAERMQVDTTVRRDLHQLGGHSSEEIDFLVDFLRPRAVEDTRVEPSSEEAGVLFAQLERVLLQLAERRPVVLVLEDIQYADSSTLAFLEYFAVTLRTQAVPVVLVLTFRPEERSQNANLEQSLRTLTSNIGAGYTRYVLKRIRGRELSRLLDSVLPLEQRLKERVGWLSQGVPLHAIQIVRYLQNEGSLVRKGERWGLKKGGPREIELPPDLMDLMRLRIEQALSTHNKRPSLKATLEWLATLGMRTPVELLSAVLGGSSGDSTSLDEDLNLLREEGIVRQTLHQNLICVEFDNSLLREAILHDLSERWANRRLHRTAAEKKVEFYRAQSMEIPLVEIAEHWRQAGESDRYRDVIFAAAQRSMHRRDLRGAREQFRELAHLLDARSDRGEIWVQAQLALAEIAWRFGEFGLAEDHFRRAIEMGSAEDREQARALRGMGHLLLVQSRHKEAVDLYQKALEAAQRAGDGAGAAKALIGLSKVFTQRSDLGDEEGVRYRLEQSLPRLPSGEIAGKVLLHLAEVAYRRGQIQKRYDYLLRARREFDSARDRQGLSDALLSLGNALMEPAMNAPDRLQQASRVLRQALELKRSLGDRFGVAEAFRQLGQLEFSQEDYAAAENLLQQSLSIHQALGTPFYIGATHNALGLNKLFELDFEAAEQHLRQALETFTRMGDELAAAHAMMNLGELALNRGDIGQAQSMLREARRAKESRGSSWAVFDIRNHLAIVSMWLGEFDDAERMLDETLRIVDEEGTGEDRAVARSLMGLLRCFQSRLQLAALELGRSRADAEDLGIRKVTVFCQANAAFYAALTEAESTFEGIAESIRRESFVYTLERGVWLSFLEQLALHTISRERSRQALRLLQTTARFHREFGDASQAEALEERVRVLEAELDDARA